MINVLPAFIAARYAKTLGHGSFVAFINRFSVAGITLGLMALIIVMSVMNGFEQQLKMRVLGLVPHLVITPEMSSNQDVSASIAHAPEVAATMPYLSATGLLQSRSAMGGVEVQGIEPDVMAQHSIIASFIPSPGFARLQQSGFPVILGRALARRLNVDVGDSLRLVVADATVVTPLGRFPSQRLVTVAGVYDAQSQLDDRVVFMLLADVRKLLRRNASSPDALRIFLHDAFQYQRVLDQIPAPVGEVKTWRERQGPLFDAVKMEKNMMVIMLTLVVAVAAFNIVSALVMVVNEKQGDIAILMGQGMPTHHIVSIFLFNGLLNGLKGVTAGIVLGIGGALGINPLLAVLGIDLNLSPDGGLPVEIQLPQLAIVACSAVALCVLASSYPALRAMRIMPARVLQND